jgi:hypothetical protein
MANSPGRRRCVDRVGSFEANMLPGGDNSRPRRSKRLRGDSRDEQDSKGLSFSLLATSGTAEDPDGTRHIVVGELF